MRSTVLAILAGLSMATLANADGVQVPVGNTLDFSPVGGTANWAMPTSSWNYDGQALTQFTTSTYTYNNNMINRWQYIQCAAPVGGGAGAGVGGIVWHFQSSTPSAMALAINASYWAGNWGGHVLALYFSDNNSWSALSPMSGGTWDDKFEDNPAWTSLDQHEGWGLQGTFTPSVNTATSDGDFWVRMDMSNTDGAEGFSGFSALSVNGTVIPEPASLALLALGGVLFLRRRR